MNGSGKSASITGFWNNPAASEGLGEPAPPPVTSEPEGLADGPVPADALPAEAGATDPFDVAQPTRTAVRTMTAANPRPYRSGRRVGIAEVIRIWIDYVGPGSIDISP